MNEIEKIEYKQNSMINQNDFTCLSLLKKIDDKFDEQQEGEVEEEEIEYHDEQKQHRRMCSTDEKVINQMPINIQSSMKTQLQSENHHEWALKIEKSSQQAIVNQEQTCKPVNAASKKKGPQKNLKSSEKKYDKKMKMTQVPGSMISANDKYNKKNIAQKLPNATANTHFLLANSMNSGDNSNQTTKRNKLKQQEQFKNQNLQSKTKMKFNHMDLSKILNDIGQQNTIQNSLLMKKKEEHSQRKSESPKQAINKDQKPSKKEKSNSNNQSQDKIQMQNQIKTLRQIELNRVINQVKKGTPSSQINLNNHFALDDKKSKIANEKIEERSTSLKRKQWSQMNCQKLGNSLEIPFQPIEINLFPIKSQKMSVVTQDQPVLLKDSSIKNPKENDVQQLNTLALDISKSISQIINQPLLQIKEQYYKKQKSNQLLEARQIFLVEESKQPEQNIDYIPESQKHEIQQEESKFNVSKQEAIKINEKSDQKVQQLKQQHKSISYEQSIYLQNINIKSRTSLQSNDITNDINSSSQIQSKHLIKNKINSQDLFNNFHIQRPNTELGQIDDLPKNEQKLLEKKSSLYEQILEMNNCQSQHSNNQIKQQNEQIYKQNLKQSVQVGISQIPIEQNLIRQNSKSSLSIKNKNTHESVIEKPINTNKIHDTTKIHKKKMFKQQSQLSLNDQDNNIYSATQIKNKKELMSNHLRRQSVIDYTSQQNIIHHHIIKNNIQNSNKDYNKSAKVEKIGKTQQLGLKKTQSQYSIDSKIIQSIQSQTSQKKLQKKQSNKQKDMNVEIYKNGKMKEKYKKLLKPSEEIIYQNLIEDDNEYCDYSDKQQNYSHASPRQIVQWTNQNIQKFIVNKNINSNDKKISEEFKNSKLNERRNYLSEQQTNSDHKNFDSEKQVNQRLVPISGIAMLQKSRSPQFIKKIGLGSLMRQFELTITPQKSPLQTKIQSTKNNSGKLQVLESWITGEKDNKLLKQSNKSGQNNSISHPKLESRKIGKIALEKEDFEELNDEDMFIEGENLSSENQQINNKIFLQQKQKSIFQNRDGNDRLSSQPPEPTEEDHPRKDALQSQLAIENIINSLGDNQNKKRSLNSSCNFDEDDEHEQKQKDESEYYQDTKELDFRSQKKQRIEINQSSYSVAQQYANRPSKQSSQSIALKYANRHKNDDNQKTLKKGKKHIQINLELNSPQFDFVDDIQIENEKIPSDLIQGQLIKKSIQKKELRDLGYDQNRERNQFNEFTRNLNFLNKGISSNKSMGQSVLNLSDPCKIYSPLTQNSNQQSFLDQKLKDIMRKEQQIKSENEQIDNNNRKTVKTPIQNKNTFIQIGTTPIQDFQNSTEIHRIMQISRRFGGASSAVLEDQRDIEKKKFYKADDSCKNEMYGQLQNNNIRSKNVKSVLSVKKIEEQKIMNNSIQQILHIQNVNNQPEINKREQYFNIEQQNNSKKKQKSQTHLNVKKQNIINKQNMPIVNTLLKSQSQYASQKDLKSENTQINNLNLGSQRSLHILQNDQTNQTQISINLSKSEIYKAKEEFIFVFGGVNITSSKNKNNKIKMERLSIEVIDILREISREFKNEQESDDEKQIIQINKNHSLPVNGFATTQIEFIQNSYNNKVTNSKESLSKDKIYLIGGQDLFGNILDTVYEYSIKDMQIFQADWKLPFPNKDFAITKLTNLNSRVSSNIIIAGGVILSSQKNEQTKTRNISKNVYRIYQEQKQNNEQKQVLGIDMQSGLLIKYEQLPDMQKERSQFQLILKQMQKNEYEIYAVGGIQDCRSDSSQFIEKFSSHNRQWEYVQIKFAKNEINQQIFCLKSHQSLFMPDGSILIVGGQALEKNGEKIEQWKFTRNMIKQVNIKRLQVQFRFDTETNEMSLMPQMNQARGYFSLILSQSLRYIYVIGGLTNSKKKANKQVWQDLVNNSLVNQIDQDEDKEFLTGITRNIGCLNSIEKFDVFSKKWQLDAPLNQKRGMHASCQIYI